MFFNKNIFKLISIVLEPFFYLNCWYFYWFGLNKFYSIAKINFFSDSS